MASLSELMAAAELADSDYRSAVVGAANARADYEMAYAKALVRAVGTSAAARKEEAEIATRDEHRKFLVAEANEKGCKTHVQVLLGLLVAKQSENKFAGKLDGGVDEW